MIRFTLLWLFVVTVSVYAWKDWFKALCGLILMMAVIQHPDMPKSLAGIQGLNPWNVVLASTMGAWLVARQREGSQWDIPRHIAVLFVLYMGVAFIAFVRMMLDSDALHEPMGYLVGEHLINVFKWVIPGIMLFDGCRTRDAIQVGNLLGTSRSTSFWRSRSSGGYRSNMQWRVTNSRPAATR